MADALLSNVSDTVNRVLEPLNDPYIRPFLLLFLAVYGGLAKPVLPASWGAYTNNIVFRGVVLAFILWIANKDPGVAIAVAMAFIVTVNVTGGKGLFEMFEGPETAVYPGCMNMKVYDLLESFNNDKSSLLNAMVVARVPGDVRLTDEYSPLISTYLLNKGFTLKSPCTPPGVGAGTSGWM